MLPSIYFGVFGSDGVHLVHILNKIIMKFQNFQVFQDVYEPCYWNHQYPVKKAMPIKLLHVDSVPSLIISNAGYHGRNMNARKYKHTTIFMLGTDLRLLPLPH